MTSRAADYSHQPAIHRHMPDDIRCYPIRCNMSSCSDEFSDGYATYDDFETQCNVTRLNEVSTTLSPSSGYSDTGSYCDYCCFDDDDIDVSVQPTFNDRRIFETQVDEKLALRDEKLPISRSKYSFDETSSTCHMTSSKVFRRSKSLKSSTVAPLTSPGVKKVVRFADMFGLDLESSIHILDLTTGHRHKMSVQKSKKPRAMTVYKRFSEPGETFDFLRRVQERKVLLEECRATDEQSRVCGMIRVANIAYQKQVNLIFIIIFAILCVCRQ
jgi:hypothetical protein